MNQQDSGAAIIEGILHPTDFSEGSRVAFMHALKFALTAQTRLTLMHVSDKPGVEEQDFPAVRETLERWGLLQPGSPHTTVAALGIRIARIVARESDPVRGILQYLDDHSTTDLLVLAAHQQEGRASWLQHSRAEPLTREAALMTLLIPDNSPGFVSAEDGSVSLQNVLIPVAQSPRAEPALDAAVQAVRRLQSPRGTFTLLHIGDEGTMPALQCPELPGWTWRTKTESGGVIQGILNTAAQTRADLIVMTTNGRNGFLDVFRGSHSERVLRQARTPILAVPEGSLVQGVF